MDIFGDIAVVASSAAWVEKYKPDIESCINRIPEINHINWRSSVELLKEEGLDLSNLEEAQSPPSKQMVQVGNILAFVCAQS